MSHWSIQRVNNENKVYGKQQLEYKTVRINSKSGYVDMKKYNNCYHGHTVGPNGGLSGIN